MSYRGVKVEHGVGVRKAIRSESEDFKSRMTFRVGM